MLVYNPIYFIFPLLLREIYLMKKSVLVRVFSFFISILILLAPLNTFAMANMELYRTLPAQTDEIENWPVGPSLSCYSAILMDADSGVILYEKNAHEKMYPASTTKLMTCILAMEKEGANLNDMVDFSWEAVMTVPWDGSNMGMDAGESMTLEECLYGILVLSANEVSNAVAEYVSDDISTFVNLMNERAKELGCLDTHFNNAHGYTDSEHYTTAYDLAMIAREFFANELLAKISRTPNYHWYATDTQPDDIYLGSTNYFMKGKKSCDGLVGSKTGYTDESRNVLVTCAERNGMKLIAVVMKEETPYQYDDTNTLFDYGFSNFEKIKVCDFETKYVVTDESFFHSDAAVFGDSSDILSMDKNATLILPKTISFSELNSELLLSNAGDDTIASVTYSYGGVFLGDANIYYTKKDAQAFVFDEAEEEITETKEDNEPTFIFINYILYAVGGVVLLILLIVIIKKLLSNFHFGERIKVSMNRRLRIKRRRRSYKSGSNYNSMKKEKKKKPRRKFERRSDYLDL